MMRILVWGAFSTALVIGFHACVYHDLDFNDLPGPTVTHMTDSNLFKESTAPGFRYFRAGQTLQGSIESPHGSFKLRFNQAAFEVLDATGELPIGSTFPEGSIIVKDVYRDADLYVIAVMKKAARDSSAADGWLWAEYRPGGSVAYTLSRKGSGCTPCHKITPNRDFVRVFDLH